MGWVWSDELADALKLAPDTAPLVPKTWTSQPCAFSLLPGEGPIAAGRRLLGLSQTKTLAGRCTCMDLVLGSRG